VVSKQILEIYCVKSIFINFLPSIVYYKNTETNTEADTKADTEAVVEVFLLRLADIEDIEWVTCELIFFFQLKGLKKFFYSHTITDFFAREKK
jgi:hypothetical protein